MENRIGYKSIKSRCIPYEELSNISAERNKSLKIIGRIIDFISIPEDNNKFADMVLECFLTKIMKKNPGRLTKKILIKMF